MHSFHRVSSWRLVFRNAPTMANNRLNVSAKKTETQLNSELNFLAVTFTTRGRLDSMRPCHSHVGLWSKNAAQSRLLHICAHRRICYWRFSTLSNVNKCGSQSLSSVVIYICASINALQLESPNDSQSPSQDDNVCVQSRTSMLNDDESQHSISVDIYTKSTGRDIINIKRNIFPEERDAESFGDVAEALRRVQQMQTIFRRNTRRLQLKIGIPEAGCIWWIVLLLIISILPSQIHGDEYE